MLSNTIDNGELLDFLELVDSRLSRKIKLIAVGGTALTLLKLKASTIDIDFTGKSEDIEEFEKAHSQLGHGLPIHCFANGQILSQAPPSNYSEKSIRIGSKFDNIELFALSPLDIICTKIGRLAPRDIEDIGTCIKNYKIKESEIRNRAS
ncbi:MAG: hypothetical protein JRN52_07890 [Nitrososphaerota archaeon]|nr:hypothetical protein [Nitrososphaerota archaeon]